LNKVLNSIFIVFIVADEKTNTTFRDDLISSHFMLLCTISNLSILALRQQSTTFITNEFKN